MSVDAVIGLIVLVAALVANVGLVLASVRRIRVIGRKKPGSLREILQEL